MKKLLLFLMASSIAMSAPQVNRVLLAVETAGDGVTGGRKDLPLTLTPGTAIVGGVANLPGVVDIATQAELDAHASRVTTNAEVHTAAANGGVVLLSGNINLSSPIIASVEGTWFQGLPGSKLTYTYTAGQSHDVFRIAAKNIRITDLEITTDHPLTSGAADTDTGIRLSDVIGLDQSGLVVERCDIHDVWACVMRSGANQEDSAYLENGRIANNNFHDFHWGIYIDYNTRSLLIDNNRMRGKDAGATHTTLGNCIWVGDNSDYTTISRNNVSDVDRNGIEVVLDPTNPVGLADGNMDPKILFNAVRDCDFGISAVGNGCIIISGNTMVRAKGIGIEAYNSVVSLGSYIITNNCIDELGTHPGQTAPSLGISLDQVNSGALVQGNRLGSITSPAATESMGIQMVTGGKDITIQANKFNDSGQFGVYINGNGTDVYTRILVDNNVFYYSAAYEAAYPAPATSWPAIAVTNAGVVAVRNNTVWYPTGEAFGSMGVATLGTVYTADSGVAPKTAGETIAESNIRIPY